VVENLSVFDPPPVPVIVLQPNLPEPLYVSAFEALLHVINPAPKKLVVEAVVAKKFVVVALVPVAFTKVKFWRVELPVAKRLANELRAEKLFTSARSVVEEYDPAP